VLGVCVGVLGDWSEVETRGVGVCFLRTLDWVWRYETANEVFIQLGAVGAVTWYKAGTASAARQGAPTWLDRAKTATYHY
jgi:hypothetical protein